MKNFDQMLERSRGARYHRSEHMILETPKKTEVSGEFQLIILISVTLLLVCSLIILYIGVLAPSHNLRN